MNRTYTGGKRQREAERDRRKKAKEDRLRHNREQRAHQPEGATDDVEAVGENAALPEVKLEDVVIGVASRPRRGTVGPTKLFVGGLSWNIGTEELKAAFLRFGPVVDAIVIQDRATGRSRGFGFVTFENPPDADEAVKQMNGAELDNRTLKVNRAEAR